VGRSKAPKLSRELGAGVEIVRALKRALDPRGIMNPGNLIPEDAKGTPGPPREVAPALARIVLDRTSLLADVAGDVPVAELEAWLAARELTLGVTGANVMDASLATWIAEGAEGSRDAWLDPADHLVAGFVARFIDGSEVVVRPAPRRSVGPDLFALVVGGRDRFASLSRVWIRVHELGGARAETAPFKGERSPALNPSEERILERIHDALR
jgi:alkyldihydroxyacetonephosphate synthase